MMVHEGILLRLMRAFPNSFINQHFEFIAHRYSNTFILLVGCESELDVKCKVLEWLSRAAYKSQPYQTTKSNKKFHRFMLDGINQFLHTQFTEDDMGVIYQNLGNGVRHDLTVEFVESDYDMNRLEREDDG